MTELEKIHNKTEVSKEEEEWACYCANTMKDFVIITEKDFE